MGLKTGMKCIRLGALASGRIFFGKDPRMHTDGLGFIHHRDAEIAEARE